MGDDWYPEGFDGKREKRVKYVVNDVEVSVVAERVQYYDKDGKLITESLKDYPAGRSNPNTPPWTSSSRPGGGSTVNRPSWKNSKAGACCWKPWKKRSGRVLTPST